MILGVLLITHIIRNIVQTFLVCLPMYIVLINALNFQSAVNLNGNFCIASSTKVRNADHKLSGNFFNYFSITTILICFTKYIADNCGCCLKFRIGLRQLLVQTLKSRTLIGYGGRSVCTRRM